MGFVLFPGFRAASRCSRAEKGLDSVHMAAEEGTCRLHCVFMGVVHCEFLGGLCMRPE